MSYLHFAGTFLFGLIAFTAVSNSAHAQTVEARVQQLSAEFWQWRAVEQPFTNDDIPRLDRPDGFTAHWSPEAVAEYRKRIDAYEAAWRALQISAAPVPVQVDYRLLGSAIARVRWELEVVPVWRRNPSFYIDQGLGATYTLMLPPPPFSAARQKDVVLRLRSVPRLLEEGRANLTDMRQPFALNTMAELSKIEANMTAFRAGVHAGAGFEPGKLAEFDKAEEAAASALVSYRAWLQPQIPTLPKATAVGRESYLYFLRNVALLPYTPEQLLTVGRLEFQRSVAFEALQQAADLGQPEMPFYRNLDAQIAAGDEEELAIRRFMVKQGILSEPPEVHHYHSIPIAPYIAALSFLGVTDDLTSPARLGDDSVSYKEEPHPGMGFFSAISAHDTRPLTIHEGVPGHYFQLAWSWHNNDPIRRHYYDSESNEGIGFYAEEMMMIAGLFDKEPRSKEAIYSMMRLRALRVEVDVRLALGDFSLQQAAQYLQHTVPMDSATANDEAAMFSSTPGQAITYQIGKSDILHLLTDARAQQGSGFSLQKFHDSLWQNGNVPLSLQRWEMLGDKSSVPPIAATFAWNANISPHAQAQSNTPPPANQ